MKDCLPLKTLSISFLLLITWNLTNAQKNEEFTPMHTFLQKNADSTLVFTMESSWVAPPKYAIISKKGDTISLYSYKLPYYLDYNLKVPRKMRDTLRSLNINTTSIVESYKVGINKFFQAKNIDDRSANALWQTFLQYKPWQIKDDKADSDGCPEKQNVIYDGGYYVLYLITKDNIKKLKFYAPDFYEEQCPGNINRKAIIDIGKLFSDTFK